MSENKYPIGGYAPGEKYDPIGCQHKLPTGLSAWSFQSESSGSGPEMDYKVCIYVCQLCGEISVGGWRWDGESKHKDHFHEEFSIHHPAAIDAIIKSANFYNEEAKWGRVTEVKPAGAVWVKASEFKHQLETDYFYKFEYLGETRKGIGEFNSDGLFVLSHGPMLPPVSIDRVYILDESGTAANKDNEIAFAEWVEREGYYQRKSDKKWFNWFGTKAAETTTDLHKLWQQSKSK